MKKYLFLFTVTPVQSFIFQARKTRDLFSGSKLLSDLIDISLTHLPKENVEIVFPNTELESKPNRFVAEIRAENDEVINELGTKLSQKVKEYFVNEGNKAFSKKISKNKPHNFDKQLEDFLIPYWAAVEISNDSSYEEKYKELEATLGATKNIKMFVQIEEEGARKCSVCGERNALVIGKKNKNSRMPAYVQHDAVSTELNDLNENEGLCAVCFTKRFYENVSYPSTAEIATMNTISEINDNENFKKYKEFLGRYYDAQLLYSENLTPKYFKKNGINVRVDDALRYYSKLKNFLKQEKLALSKYYALIMFDGDSMGKWLSGEFLRDNVDLKEFHKNLTKAIGRFAKETKEILKEPKGKVIFAGGEDFLGFVNLSSLFDVVKELRGKYNEIINNSLREYIKEEKQFTFSAGIVIAHYKIPLSEVLNWARKTEKEAKNLSDEKNAFALAVLKHSGEIHQTVYKWSNNGKSLTENFDIIGDIVRELLEEHFSNTFITSLRNEFLRLKYEKEIEELIKAEIERLVTRAYMMERLENETKEEIEPIIGKTKTLLENSENDNSEFFYALEIADFIHRKIEGEE